MAERELASGYGSFSDAPKNAVESNQSGRAESIATSSFKPRLADAARGNQGDQEETVVVVVQLCSDCFM